MIRFTITTSLLLLGCGTQKAEPQQPTDPPQSQPLSSFSGGGEQVEVMVYPEGRKPVSRARLRELWPPLKALPEDALRTVAEAVNVIPSPCVECGSIPVAHCFEKVGTESCKVLDKLFKRVTGLAAEGAPQRKVKESINYPDVWFDGMGEGSPAKVTVYRNESGPFNAKTTEAIAEIRKEFGDGVVLDILGTDVEAPANLEVRARPTWFINGHRFRGSQSTTILKRFIQYEIADSQK